MLGRSALEVKRSLSLPEILVMLERADYRRSVDLLAQTRSRYLASGAKWNQGIGDKLREFLGELADVVDPSAPAPKASTGDLVKMFGLLGIKPQS